MNLVPGAYSKAIEVVALPNALFLPLSSFSNSAV